MTKIKALLPENKHLRRIVILFALGIIVRLVFFIMGDVSAASAPADNEHSEKLLGGFSASLAVGNPILIVGMIFAFSGIDKLTGITVPSIAGLIVIQLINLALDCFFLIGVCKFEKSVTPVKRMLLLIYTVVCLAGTVPGLVFYQIPFNTLSIIALIMFYVYNTSKKDKKEQTEENEEGLSE